MTGQGFESPLSLFNHFILAGSSEDQPLGAKWVLSNHFFGFGIKQRDLFEVELDGDLFTQMK